MFHRLRDQDVACVWPEVGSATKSLGQCFRIFIELNFLQHAADIGDTWLQPNCLQLLSQNSFEDDDLPMQVKKRMCSHGFRQELRTFQPNTFQDKFLDTWKFVWKNVLFELSNYGFLRQ